VRPNSHGRPAQVKISHLKRMVEGSKVHSKEVRARRRTQKNGRGLEGALEGGEGWKAQSKGGKS